MLNSATDDFMRQALLEAKRAFDKKEVPIGCVIHDEKKNVLSKAHNLVETYNNPIMHAEMIAIFKALRKTKSKYLTNCSIYITLEPCLMCCEAIFRSRVAKIYYAAPDTKFGGLESNKNMSSTIYHKIKNTEIYSGILEKNSVALLKKFFFTLRQDKKFNMI